MKTALIIGASRSLGYALAEALAEALARKGWRLAIDGEAPRRSKMPRPSWRSSQK
ncbi:MAG: hypothetical protein ACHQ7M_16910 [Chloroflexota bacterium]